MARITTAFFLWFHDYPLTGEALENAARYDVGWLKYDTEILTGGTSLPQLWETKSYQPYVVPLKARNPEIRMGLYIEGGAAMAREIDPAYVFCTDAQALHQPDGGVMRVLTAGRVHVWPNYVRDGVRADHIAQYLAFCETYELDLLFMDSWLPSAYAGWIATDPESVGGSQEGPTHTTAYWLSSMPTWTLELQTALAETGRAVYANGIAPVAYDTSNPEQLFLGPYQENIVDYAGGVLFETWYRVYGEGASTLVSYCQAVLATQAKGGAVYVLSLPWIWTLAPPGFPIPEVDVLRRYYLSAYLLIQDPRSWYGHQPYLHTAYYGFDDAGATRVHWDADYERDYGDPAGHAYLTETFSWRDYTRGVAVVNPTTTSYQWTRPGTYRVWGAGPRITVGPGDADDTTVSGIELPPQTGWWLEFGDAA